MVPDVTSDDGVQLEPQFVPPHVRVAVGAVAGQDVRASSTGSGLESERESEREIGREQMVNELQWLLNLEPINIYISRYMGILLHEHMGMQRHLTNSTQSQIT
jgi:hypothetical protein